VILELAVEKYAEPGRSNAETPTKGTLFLKSAFRHKAHTMWLDTMWLAH